MHFTANDHTAVLFILGTDVTLSIDEKLELQEEENLYGDLIRVDGLTENYNNLTLKTLYTLKEVLTRPYGPHFYWEPTVTYYL